MGLALLKALPAVKRAGNMPTWATNMVALPFALSIRNELFEDVGSASILLALAGMLPASYHSVNS